MTYHRGTLLKRQRNLPKLAQRSDPIFRTFPKLDCLLLGETALHIIRDYWEFLYLSALSTMRPHSACYVFAKVHACVFFLLGFAIRSTNLSEQDRILRHLNEINAGESSPTRAKWELSRFVSYFSTHMRRNSYAGLEGNCKHPTEESTKNVYGIDFRRYWQSNGKEGIPDLKRLKF